MSKYVLRRLLEAVPLLLLVTVVVFVVLQLLPGGPLAAYAGEPGLSLKPVGTLANLIADIAGGSRTELARGL